MRLRSVLQAFACCCLLLGQAAGAAADSSAPSKPVQAWSGDRALADIARQLSFGIRSMGYPGHEETIKYITAEMTRLHFLVARQDWTFKAQDGRALALSNIIARSDMLNRRRVILGTHYDSIVRAYADPERPNAPMPGANNSASGVALLLETARALRTAPRLPFGIDFVFFDGEEGPKSLGAGDPQWFALGSPHFVDHLADFYPEEKPEQGILFDMVCYKNIRLRPELISLDSDRENVERFWQIGSATAPALFTPDPTSSPIGDDQEPLDKAGIPAMLVIGFEYDPWFNTTKDTIDKCAASTLEGIGRTLLKYLSTEG